MLGNTIEGLKDILSTLTGTKKDSRKLCTTFNESKEQTVKLPSEKKILSKEELRREFNSL